MFDLVLECTVDEGVAKGQFSIAPILVWHNQKDPTNPIPPPH